MGRGGGGGGGGGAGGGGGSTVLKEGRRKGRGQKGVKQTVLQVGGDGKKKLSFLFFFNHTPINVKSNSRSGHSLFVLTVMRRDASRCTSSPDQRRWRAKNGSSVGTCTRCVHVSCTFGADLHVESALNNKNFCVGAQSDVY